MSKSLQVCIGAHSGTDRADDDDAPGHADALAAVDRLELAKVLSIPLDKICELVEELGPCSAVDVLAPRRLERLARGSDGEVDILLASLGNQGDLLTRSRVQDRERLARRGRLPLVVWSGASTAATRR
ncbi:MAG: hypothetical protein PW947_16025 [Paraburkholderia sp.]|nr:hypothetical protein [Paraburkholderia sp.]MDE1181959.1 hypothetical protein [Paraburkholderia sp.]